MLSNTELTETEANQIGLEIIDLLALKLKKNGLVGTSFGDKTPTGLARTVWRLAETKLANGIQQPLDQRHPIPHKP